MSASIRLLSTRFTCGTARSPVSHRAPPCTRICCDVGMCRVAQPRCRSLTGYPHVPASVVTWGCAEGHSPLYLNFGGFNWEMARSWQGRQTDRPLVSQDRGKAMVVAPDSNPEPEQLSGPLSPHHARMGQKRS